MGPQGAVQEWTGFPFPSCPLENMLPGHGLLLRSSVGTSLEMPSQSKTTSSCPQCIKSNGNMNQTRISAEVRPG